LPYEKRAASRSARGRGKILRNQTERVKKQCSGKVVGGRRRFARTRECDFLKKVVTSKNATNDRNMKVRRKGAVASTESNKKKKKKKKIQKNNRPTTQPKGSAGQREFQ